jgi:hypothetical protein
VRKVLLVALALTAVAVPAFAVAAPSETGPACADITDGVGSFSTTGEFEAQVTLGAPPCNQFDYTFFIRTSTGTIALAPDQVSGSTLIFRHTIESDDETICVSATTSVGKGAHVFDTAPDTVECLVVPRGGDFATAFR